MSISLDTRIRKLEQTTPKDTRYILTWDMPADTQAVQCDGVRYERHPDESLEELTARAAAASTVAGMVWVDAVE